MAVVVILAELFFGGATMGSSWVTCRTVPDVSSSSRLIAPASRGSSSPGVIVLPGKVLWATFDITTLPSLSSKRVIKPICRSEPPTSSQGSQKL
ncbi:MAG TPA: hypothetical protein VMY37_40465 [Thermoguttaceae bacterium]|nr:hypothetical protein [Thermoguttaceae bacterium]